MPPSVPLTKRQRASGPPPRGLFEYEWRIDGDSFEILGGRLPGLQETT